MLTVSVRIIGVFEKELTLISTKEVLKVKTVRDEWRKLIAQDWRRPKPVWEDS